MDLNKRLIKRSAFLKMLGGMGVAMTPAASAFAYGGCATGSYYAQYYTGVNFNKLKKSRCEAAPLDNNWGTGKISPLGRAVDNLSARWTGEFNFQQPGEYEFTATADDGIRVYVDGVRIIDQWRDQAPTTYRTRRTLAAGTHEVKVEYYERTSLAVCKLSWAAVPSNPNPLPAHQAMSTERFVESIGICNHMRYTDTVYNNFASLKARYIESKVRYIRHGALLADAATNDLIYGRHKELAAAGIRMNYLLPRENELMPMSQARIADIAARAGNSLATFEGPNEYNLQHGGPPFGSNAAWDEEFESWTQEMHSAIRANPSTQNTPILAGTLTDGWSEIPNLSAYFDYANIHPYPGPHHPEHTGFGNYDDHVAWNSLVMSPRPLMATESGYHNAINSSSSHQPVPESVAATYIPRLVANFFNRGCKRTFIYEMIDLFPDPEKDDDQLNFGLLRNDFSPKPAFSALKNLITILEDPGQGAFSPSSLSFTLEGTLSDVHQVLLQKANGKFYLLLWLGLRIYDPTTKQLISVSGRQLTLQLGRQSSVNVYEPNSSISAIATHVGVSSVPVTVSEKLRILEIA